MQLFRLPTQLYAHRCRAAQSEVEQHEVGHLLFEHFPVGRLAIGGADDVGLGNVGFYDSYRSFQFKRNVFYDDNFKVLHSCIWVMLWSSMCLHQ